MPRSNIRLLCRRFLFPQRVVQPCRKYNYNHFESLNPGPSKFKRFITINFWIVSCTAFAYYMWWPKHMFPSSVAKYLRKGLWAESDKGEQDYQLALKHYLEALEECDRLKMDPLSDEYTGVQIKIGEMYERLGRIEDAAFVYNEIATLYLSILRAAPSSPLGLRVHGASHRAHLIQKDLRIALKLVEINRLNPLLSKAILITHLLIAQEEVNKRLGSASEFASLIASPELVNDCNTDYNPETYTLISNLGNDSESNEASQNTEVVLKTNPEAWEPFSEEFFNAMDILSAICISVNDVQTASDIRISMAKKLLLAGVSPERLLLAQCNTASLLYFQAEQLQAQEQVMRKTFAEIAVVDYEKFKSIHDPMNPLVVGKGDAQDIKQRVNKSISKEDKAKYEQIVLNKDELFRMVIAIYQSVIDGAKRLPQNVVKDNTAISESVALATYGLGVVNLHLSQYDLAERYLREARVRSKACGYDALISEIERELSKLFAEKTSVKQNEHEEIELDIHLVK